MTVLNAVLTIGGWAIICLLLVVLYRIARFYEISSGRRSYYQFFTAPLVLFALGAVVSTVLVGALVWSDLLMLIGGLILVGLGFYLLRLMTGNRP